MTDDLVKRLRVKADDWGTSPLGAAFNEAADALEALAGERDAWEKAAREHMDWRERNRERANAAEAERDRLKAQVDVWKTNFNNVSEGYAANGREVARFKTALYEAINNEEDRLDYFCKCKDCEFTLTGIGDKLRAVLGEDE